MVSKYSELELEKCETPEAIDQKVKEQLGHSFADFKQLLSDYVLAHAKELVQDLHTMIPHGDYSKALEGSEAMISFLKTEAYKPEFWEMSDIGPDPQHPDLVSFRLINTAVDEGDVLDGFVYVSLQGKIKHAFAQAS